MYKKVTHNIVEEHFAHPAAAHIKASLTYGYKPEAMETNSTMNFRKDSKYYLAKFFWRVRSYIVSVTDSAEDQMALEMQLFKDIYKVAELIKPFYGDAAATTFEQRLKAVAIAAVEVIKAVKAGRDPVDLRNQAIMRIDELAAFLSTANPSNWPAAAVSNIFTKLLDAWIDQTTSRTKKMWDADFAASDAASHLFMNGLSGDPSAFTDIFANGIIQQFPDNFRT